MKRDKPSPAQRKSALTNDQGLRRQLFARLLKHVECGYSLDCFQELSIESINTFLKEFPEEFCRESLDQSLRGGKRYWEDIGVRQADGKCLGNSRSWVYNMMNRFGWTDKAKVETETKGAITVSVVNYGTHNAPTT
jgi:hypothetical protein